MDRPRFKMSLAAVIAALGWFGLILQFYLAMEYRRIPLPEAIINFFSFYTILSNILVAICFTCIFLNLKGRIAEFFTSQQAQCAMTVYIVIVGVIYNVVLRGLIHPRGWAQVVDELLHLVIPALTLVYWLVFSPKSNLSWRDIYAWTIFPIIYFFYTFIHGAVSGFYPYPFVDVHVLGYPKVLLNCLLIIAGFLLLSFLFIAAGRYLSSHDADRK
jgi:hypothetical protein